ncbi:hypothetical protein BGZ68_001883 [Mortierella alpina]|nr:hypothetical protein BGZ68_001883 [Mortierella alpina]
MNSLVSYASDSESDADEIIPPPAPRLAASAAGHSLAQELSPPEHNGLHHSDKSAPATLAEDMGHGQDDFVSAALKDLQTFAASVGGDADTLPDNPVLQASLDSQGNNALTEPGPLDMDVDQESAHVVPEDDIIMAEATAVAEVTSPPRTPVELTSEQQAIFDAFMLKIDAIPLMLDDRLIEFAIRILDWDQGGMKPAYFMGEGRAQFLSHQKSRGKSKDRGRSESHSAGSDDSEDDSQDEDTATINPPPYGGIVAEMLELMRKTEQAAAPDGWEVVWDAMRSSYGFRHWVTGTLSSIYPSDEMKSPCPGPGSAE